MTKKLIVNKPFGYMEAGDEFILSEDGKEYVAEHESSYNKSGDDSQFDYNFYSKYSIYTECAKQLVDEEVLMEDEFDKKANFKNVFDEIDNLRTKYMEELKDMDRKDSDAPACLRVEKRTVLSNLVKVLDYLKSLKK